MCKHLLNALIAAVQSATDAKIGFSFAIFIQSMFGRCVEEEKELSEINNYFVNSTSYVERCAYISWAETIKLNRTIVERISNLCSIFFCSRECVLCAMCVCLHSLVRDSVQQMNIKVCSRSRLKLMNSPVCSFVLSAAAGNLFIYIKNIFFNLVRSSAWHRRAQNMITKHIIHIVY